MTGFRHSFIPLAGCFSPFPHGTRALSVAGRMTALEGGPPCFPQDFACPAVLGYATDASQPRRRLRGSHPLWRGFPAASAAQTPTPLVLTDRSRPTTPLGPKAHRFGLRPFRSPLLRASRLISLPRGTEMFQFPRCPACGLCIPPPLPTLARRRVAPFGSDRLIARLQLPGHVSPLSASFFGTRPLGIPPSPLSAWR